MEYKCKFCQEYFSRDDVHHAGKVTKKDGSLSFYWSCNPCETARAKKYRETKGGRSKINRAVAKSMKKNNVKQNARVMVNMHIKKGKLVRPTHCSACDIKCKPEGHHEDYSKPLQVIWLCKRCHYLADRILEQKK